MRRDWDVVRAILLGISAEDRDSDEGRSWEVVLEEKIENEFGISSEVLDYYFKLMIDADLIYGSHQSVMDPDSRDVILLGELTWKGQDLLDDIQDSKVWALVKEKLSKVGGMASLEMLKVVAKDSITTILL